VLAFGFRWSDPGTAARRAAGATDYHTRPVAPATRPGRRPRPRLSGRHEPALPGKKRRGRFPAPLRAWSPSGSRARRRAPARRCRGVGARRSGQR